MRLYFLGTNGWYDTKLRNTLSVLLDTDKAYVIFDAGSGFYKLDKYIKKDKPIFVLLSHFHLDHIIGLHALNRFKFAQGINIFGPKGIKKVFSVIINSPFSMPVNKLKTRITIKEFTNDLKLPVDIKYRKLFHSSVCYGYRVFAENKSVTFCTDTGLCSNLNLLAKGADVLIEECSLPPGKIDNNWPHLNPQQAAYVAKGSKAKKLILVHFDAGVYLTKADRLSAQKSARRIFKKTFLAVDGMVLRV